MRYVVAVVGATGAVGREMLRTLERRRFPVQRLVALASARSEGTVLPFGDGSIPVEALEGFSFQGVDLALFSAGATASAQYAPLAAAAGALVIDNSSAWRLDPDVPLVVAEVNVTAAAKRPKGIVANPNCVAMPLTVVLSPLHHAAGLRHVVVSTYQAASGKGHAATQELLAQTRALLEGHPPPEAVFPGTLAFNLLCDWKHGQQGYSEEEIKVVQETQKILGLPALAISPTTVRVPVLSGHALSVHVQFDRPLGAAEACALLRTAEGVVLSEEGYRPGSHPQPAKAAGTDPVYVGRIREDLTLPGALNLWIVSDNLRKGAALNAVQVAERLLQLPHREGFC